LTAAIVLGLRILAIAALYAFLGIALWTMWRELQRSAALRVEGEAPAIQLELRGRGHGSRLHRFNGPEIILGRDPMSDVVLDDAAVSAHHARLSYHDGQWWIDDLDSTNGTRLNRELLLVPAALASGDEIKCGSARLGVTLFEGTP